MKFAESSTGAPSATSSCSEGGEECDNDNSFRGGQTTLPAIFWPEHNSCPLQESQICFTTNVAGELTFSFARMIAKLDTDDTSCSTTHVADLLVLVYAHSLHQLPWISTQRAAPPLMPGTRSCLCARVPSKMQTQIRMVIVCG